MERGNSKKRGLEVRGREAVGIGPPFKKGKD